MSRPWVSTQQEFLEFERMFHETIGSSALMRKELMLTYRQASKDFSDPCVMVSPNMVSSAMSFMEFYNRFVVAEDQAEYMKLWKSRPSNYVPIILSSIDWGLVIAGEVRTDEVPENYYYRMTVLRC